VEGRGGSNATCGAWSWSSLLVGLKEEQGGECPVILPVGKILVICCDYACAHGGVVWFSICRMYMCYFQTHMCVSSLPLISFINSEVKCPFLPFGPAYSPSLFFCCSYVPYFKNVL
jgi:hypothetical protein